MTTTHILLIAHAPLAGALRECVRHVFPDWIDSVTALDVLADDAPETTQAQAQAVVDGLSGPVLVLCDVFGATPANVAQRLVHARPARLLTGVNVPMLLRAVTYRHEPMEMLVQRALDGGAQGMIQLGLTAPQQQ